MSNDPSPSQVSVQVPGKINLALCVGPRRGDGYHRLSTLFQAVSLHDDLLASVRSDGQLTVAMTGEGSEQLPCDQTNLAVAAASLLRRRYASPTHGVDLRIDKHVPMAGGMAGGSADAAATLLACNELWQLGLGRETLAEVAAELGSDVSFLLYGGNALGTGRGEQLVVQPASGQLEWVFAIAQHGLSTALVYQHFDLMAERGAINPSAEMPAGALDELCSGDPARVGAALRNDLQPAALELYPELRETLSAGLDAGASAALVCGSGPTCAFLAADPPTAAELAEQLADLPEVRAVRRAYGPVPGPQARRVM